MPLILRWRGDVAAPVDGSTIRPDGLTGPADAGARQSVRVGNGSAGLGDLFDIEGDGGDGHLIVEGDVRAIHSLGAGMAAGRLEIRGDAGHRLAVGMTGGEVEVFGSVEAAAGNEMAGGVLRIRGHAGAELGAALPGSRVGMRGGVIVVGGDAGDGVGTALRRGIIAVQGSVGAGAGRGLVAGSIVVGGRAGADLGAGMKRGTIALFDADFEPGPTFEPSGSLRPPVATILLRELAARGFVVPAPGPGAFRRYNGDRAIGGRGEIWHFGGTR